MKLRNGKHWELLTENNKPCRQCGRVTAMAMKGKSGETEGEILCKSCALKWNETEREISSFFKTAKKIFKSYSWILCVVMSLLLIYWSLQYRYKSDQIENNHISILTQWAYSKADQRVSYAEAGHTVLMHMKYSSRPYHTLAIVMAESRFYRGATNTICKDAWGGGQIRWTVWGKILEDADIIQDKRDLFDPEPTAKAVSFILDHFLSLIPDDLKTPGLKITCALTMYVGDVEGRAVMKGLAQRNTKLTNTELRDIISKLKYPVEVLAFVGEMLAIK